MILWESLSLSLSHSIRQLFPEVRESDRQKEKPHLFSTRELHHQLQQLTPSSSGEPLEGRIAFKIAYGGN